MTIKRPMFPPSRRDVINTIASLPLAAAAPAAAAAPTRDTELIELGARFEPLVDQYYVARTRWARSLTRAHAEQDCEFGDPASRNYEYTSEFQAAFADRCERLGVDDASGGLSSIHDEMKPLANAIAAAAVTSIEGLRAKALLAFMEVAPLGASDSEFSFEDDWPFRMLFTAVAELCGLKDKIEAAGYVLPEIGLAYDKCDEEDDDEGEDA